MQLTPTVVINIVRWIIVSVLIYVCYSYTNGINKVCIFSGSGIVAKILSSIFNKPTISLAPGISTFFISMLIALWVRILYRLGAYLANTWIAIYLFIVKKHRIKKISLIKKYYIH